MSENTPHFGSVETPVETFVAQLPPEPVIPTPDDTPVVILGNNTPPIEPDKLEAISKIIPTARKASDAIDYSKKPKLILAEDDRHFDYEGKNYQDVIKESRDEGIEAVTMPTDAPKRIADLLNQRPNIDPTLTEKGNHMVLNLRSGDDFIMRHDILHAAVHDELREFAQSMYSPDGKRLRAVNPKQVDIGKTSKALTGEAAVMRIQGMLGLGGVVQVPLWHSGFWVTIKTPSDVQLLALHEQLIQDKADVGRQTFGLAFSNDMVYLMEPIMNLFVSCIYATSLKEGTNNILDKIKIQDFQTVCWGLACAVWPNGFQYTRSILDTTNGGADDRIVSAKLNVRKLLWVDNTGISDTQRMHMSKRDGRQMTDDQLKDYQEQFNRPRVKRVKLKDMLHVDLKVPNITENLVNGKQWVSDIKDMLEEVLMTTDYDENNIESKRRSLMHSYSRATLMCQYSHWVKSIGVVTPDGVEEMNEDADTIYLMLQRLSGDNDIRDTFIREVVQFISDTTVSIVGIPTVKEDEEYKLDAFPHLLPLDAMYLFFTLLVQRAERITR